MKNLRNIVFLILALAFAPTIVSGQCDPDGVWLERQAYTSSSSLLLGYSGCVRSATVISPLQVSHDTLRLVNGSVIGYVLTWNGSIWVPAATDRQTISAGDGSGIDKTISLSDGGGTVTLRPGTNVDITRSNDTLTISATPGAGGDPSVTNEGSLTVGAGGSNTSTIVSNTSGSTPVTVSGSNTILVTESGSTITLQGDTSLLATINDLNTQRTFIKVGGGDANYNVNAYRNGTTGFRTEDTTGVANIKVVSLTKPGLYQEGKTGQSVMFTKFAPIGYSGLTGLGSFNITGGYYAGVNSPISSRPNFVYDIGYNLKPGGIRENTHEPTLGFGFETFYTNAALHASDGFMEAHWRTMDTFGIEHRHISYVAPWNGKRNRDVMSIASDQFNLLDFGEASVWAVRPNSNLWSIADSTLMQFTEPRGFGLSVYNGAGSAAMTLFDFNNTDTLEVGRSNLPATRVVNMLIVDQSKIYPRWTDNELQIGSSSSPNRRADLWINQKTANGLRLIGATRTWAFENSGNLAINDITAGTTPLYLYTGSSSGAFVFRSDKFGVNVTGAFPEAVFHGRSTSGATAKMLRIENSTGVADYYRSNATPEGAISGSPSDFATANISGTGAAFLKVTGTGSTTGWEQLLTKSSGQQNLVMTRTLPTTVGNTVNLGYFEKTGGGGYYFELSAITVGSGTATAKKYKVPSVYNSTGGAWHVLLPISSTGGFASEDFEIEMKSVNYFDTLRVRRTSGTTATTLYVTLNYTTSTSLVGFTESTATASPATVTTAYIYNSVSQVANKTGINNFAPTQALHVTGNIRATGAYYDSSNDPGSSGQILSSTVTGTDWISAGSVGGSGTSGQVAYWNGTTSITGSAGWLFDGSSAETLKSTSGDPITKYSITGGSTWTLGTDNSDADRFKLSLGNALGTNDKIYVDTTGKTYLYNTIVVNTQDANVATLGSVPGTTNYPGLWFGSATPSLTNYAILADVGASKTILNAPSSGKISFAIANSEKMRMTSTGLSIQAGANPVNPLDVEGAAVIGATYAGTNAGPTNGLLVEGNLGVGNTSPSQKAHITGNMRVTGAFYDSNNDPGSSGQVLSSTVTGTDWIAAATGTLTAANNGLYVSGTTVRMGTNPLIEATLIDQDANDMRFYDGKWSYSSRSISWTPTQGMGVQGLEASPTTNSTPTQDGIIEFAVTNSGNSLQSNSLIIGAYATDADGIWMQARSNAVPNVNYPLQLQPRGGNFSVGRVTATLAKATFAAVALPGSTAAGSVVHWESTEGNKKAAATFGVGTDVVDGEIAYFDSLDITRITNRNPTTGTSSVRIAVGGETSDRVTVVASTVTPSARMGIGTATPNSTLHSAGSFASACTTFTGALTLDERDSWRAYTGTTNVTVTLPAASTCAGREYTIHHRGTAGTLTLSIAINKGNGATFNTLAAGQFAFIKSDGTAWNGIKLASL